MTLALRPPLDRRFTALALTVLVHAVLLLGWQASRHLPRALPQADPARIQWIDLRPRLPAMPRPVPAPAQVPERTRERTQAPAPAREAAPAMIFVPAPPADGGAASTPSSAPSPASSSAPSAAPAAPPAGSLVQGALRAAHDVDKTLRKENNAYIVAPPDSPQIRLRKGMEAAHEMAPPKLWEAPQMDELANPTGNGERHTRVRGAFGTYCIGNRSVGSSMALNAPESGSQLHTSQCLSGEEPAAAQEWKTARD